jgi:hypothetical protein
MSTDSVSQVLTEVAIKPDEGLYVSQALIEVAIEPDHAIQASQVFAEVAVQQPWTKKRAWIQ